MADEQDPGTEKAPDKNKTPFLTRTRLIAAAIGIGGMIVGSLVGIGVQMGVERTGLLGPSVEALIAEQESNFSEVSQQLDALKKMSGDPEVKKSLAELGKMLARQDELSRHASAELGYLGDQVAAMKNQQLTEAGFAGGADFWLKPGESVNVGGRDQVFSLLGARGTLADVNLNGTRKRLLVGDTLPVTGEDASCTVFFKLAERRADGRIGFDLNCSPATSS